MSVSSTDESERTNMDNKMEYLRSSHENFSDHKKDKNLRCADNITAKIPPRFQPFPVGVTASVATVRSSKILATEPSEK